MLKPAQVSKVRAESESKLGHRFLTRAFAKVVILLTRYRAKERETDFDQSEGLREDFMEEAFYLSLE